ncbi:transposase, partial [Oceanobacillus oncorhynchi]|uniref:transposase n=1 Tax=Oceanobacillus oncorhynchi TaxID=545501 RepID=UPI001868001D
MVKRYDKEFKVYAVKLVVEDGRKATEVARELDLVPQTLIMKENGLHSKTVKKYKATTNSKH